MRWSTFSTTCPATRTTLEAAAFFCDLRAAAFPFAAISRRTCAVLNQRILQQHSAFSRQAVRHAFARTTCPSVFHISSVEDSRSNDTASHLTVSFELSSSQSRCSSPVAFIFHLLTRSFFVCMFRGEPSTRPQFLDGLVAIGEAFGTNVVVELCMSDRLLSHILLYARRARRCFFRDFYATRKPILIQKCSDHEVAGAIELTFFDGSLSNHSTIAHLLRGVTTKRAGASEFCSKCVEVRSQKIFGNLLRIFGCY